MLFVTSRGLILAIINICIVIYNFLAFFKWDPVQQLGAAKQGLVNPLAPGPAFDPSDSVALMVINSHRLTHQAPLVTYSTTLKNLAAQCANWYVAIHMGPLPFPLPRPSCLGTTAGATIGFSQQINTNGIRAAIGDTSGQSWFLQYMNNQASFPPFARASFSPSYQDFTQMIWVSSSKVGCAWSTNSVNFVDGITAYIYICLWSPAGNIPNAFAQNVLAEM